MAKAVSQNLGTGRRKTAVARVRLASGTGKIVINGRAFENYFPVESLRMVVSQPFVVTGTADKFDAQITVSRAGRISCVRACANARNTASPARANASNTASVKSPAN